MSAIAWGRVRLTPLDDADLEAVNRWQNDPYIRDQIMGFRGPVRLETTAEWIRNLAAQNLRSRVVFGIRLDDAIKGVAQLHGIDWVQRSALLGVFVGDAGDRGVGLGRAAVTLVLDYAFDGLDLQRIALEVMESNAAARRLYEALGFVQEGLAREAFLRAGAREDVALYGLLRREFTARLPADAHRLVSPAPQQG